MFPYLFLISVAAFFQGILNGVKIFTPSGFTPILFNIFVISFTYIFAKPFGDPAVAMSYGVVAGGLVQAVFQLPFVLKTGFSFKLTSLAKTFSNPGTKKSSCPYRSDHNRHGSLSDKRFGFYLACNFGRPWNSLELTIFFTLTRTFIRYLCRFGRHRNPPRNVGPCLAQRLGGLSKSTLTSYKGDSFNYNTRNLFLSFVGRKFNHSHLQEQ